MKLDAELLTDKERIIFALRALYREAGYTLFKMSKFEEYDLYARNKDFLISENVLTFTDAGGALMALKPDVTLSIVRAFRDGPGTVRKLCYNENVYRTAGHGGPFRELTQAGLECIGAVGDAEIAETLELALTSLRCAAGETPCALSVSHLGILREKLDGLLLPEEKRDAALRCVQQKNAHELESLCAGEADAEAVEAVKRLLRLSGPARDILPELDKLCRGGAAAAVELLRRVTAGLDGNVNIDFSIAGNLKYYNGIVFNGYVEGVPAAVLSGGQYDQLLRKLGRDSRAIGFAVYVDLLERLSGTEADEA